MIHSNFSSCLNVVVDLQQQAHCLSRKLDRAGGDQQRLDDLLLENVGDEALADVDSGIALAESMAVAELGDNGDWVEASVLSEGGRDDFKCVCVGLETVCLHSLERLCVLGKESRDMDLRGTTASYQSTAKRWSVNEDMGYG